MDLPMVSFSGSFILNIDICVRDYYVVSCFTLLPEVYAWENQSGWAVPSTSHRSDGWDGSVRNLQTKNLRIR